MAPELDKPAANEVPPEDIVWINGYATPPAPRIAPFHAVASVLRLIRNKEDTRQVFEVVQALSGKAGHNFFNRFTSSPYGVRVANAELLLETILGDRSALRTLPEGSFGRAYLDFMEGENLTPEGLRGAAEEAGIDYSAENQFPAYVRTFLHLQVSHDLWHVLTGYGRDALGELCNLGFTYQQTKNPGFPLIIFIGMLAQKREAFGTPIIKAIREGFRIGAEAEWVPSFDVEALLPLPLEEVRKKLNVKEPVIYNAVPLDVKTALLQPKVTKTQTERELERGANAAV